MNEPTIRRPRGRPIANDTASRIIKEATELFLEKGYVATTMQDIADRFGGSKQTIYARFPDKKALFREVVIAFTERRLAQTRALAFRAAHMETTLKDLAKELVVAAYDRETVAIQRLVISEADRVPELLQLLEENSSIPAARVIENIMMQFVESGNLQGNPSELAIRFCDLTLSRHVWAAVNAGKTGTVTEKILQDQAAAVDFFLKIAST